MTEDGVTHGGRGGELYPIGALARRTGLSVKAIRFYADRGIVPPTDRSPAGYRLYDVTAVARLDLVRTLRELGVDLATVRRVLDREASLPEVASAHAEALDLQIRTLRLRRAVLRAVAKRGSTPKELELMHKLARLSDEERRRLVTDFLDEVFGGLEADPGFVAMMRSAMPELPDDPLPEQVEAWVELAELVQDPDFRASVRRMAVHGAENPVGGEDTMAEYKALNESVQTEVAAAIAAGTAPESAAGGRLADALRARFAAAFGRTDGAAVLPWLIERIEVSADPRAERYWELLAVINGWPRWPSQQPVYQWLLAAFRARLA